jgi:Helix-turn-helix domain
MISDKAQLILHPLRMRLIQAVAGQKLTASQIGEILPDVAQATLYRQIKKLVDGGILQIAEEKPVRGTIEKIYVMANPTAALLTPQDMQNLTVDEHMQLFISFTATLINDFANYLQKGNLDPVADGVGYRQIPLYLSDGEFGKMVTGMNEAMLPYLNNLPSPERKRRIFSSVVMPADPKPERNGTNNE